MVLDQFPDVSTLVPWLLALSVVGRTKLKTVYQWRQLDFEFPSAAERQRAVASGDFVQANTLPLGLDAYGDRIFVSMPRWKDGIPATLATVPRDPRKVGTDNKPPKSTAPRLKKPFHLPPNAVHFLCPSWSATPFLLV